MEFPTLSVVRQEILAKAPPRGNTVRIMAVDGHGGAGKFERRPLTVYGTK